MFPPLSPQPDTPPDMTTTAQETLQTQNQANLKPDEVDPKVKKVHDEFRSRIDICKIYRRKLIANWTINIDYRRGKPFTSQTDDDQIAVNLDWSLTKAKQASLFSQVPQARIDHVPDTLPKASPFVVKFERRLNDVLREAGIESAMDECLPDCINASGIGVILVSYESITEDREVPVQDLSSLPPEVLQQAMLTKVLNGQSLQMETIPAVVDHRYVIQRISPGDLLWPINYTGSDFDNAPWLGRSGRIPWAESVQRFKLQEADKATVLGEDRPQMDKLTHDVERDKVQADEMVGFDEIFYKEFQYNSDSKSYSTIHHLVFVNGKDIPVIDEPWKGQKVNPDNSVIGALKYPVRVLTFTYITDETIPPSDSAIGRPQVNEINKARSQMIRQRERSLPVRWFDVNRVDPSIQQGLMRGTWQAMIPVQGEGSRIIGEVARATMPQENFLFDKIAKDDLWREFVVGQPGQEVTEAEGDPDQNEVSFNTVAGRERAKVASFFTEIAEVTGGLMCLYEDPASFGEGFDPAVSKVLKVSILADSTVLLETNQRLNRLNQFVNTYAKSGWVNIEPVLQEIASLAGLDPSIVIKAPEPKPPVEPNISLRLTGVEDMLNPLALAFLIKSGQAPEGELIEKAKALIQQAVTPPFNPAAAPIGPGQQFFMGEPQSATEGSGSPPLPPPVPGPPPGIPLPSPPPPAVGAANPQWTVMPALNKRSEGTQ